MRQCPFDGCTQIIPPTLFACKRHWFTLTQPQREEIYAAYRDYEADRIGVEELSRRQQAVLDAAQGVRPGAMKREPPSE